MFRIRLSMIISYCPRYIFLGRVQLDMFPATIVPMGGFSFPVFAATLQIWPINRRAAMKMCVRIVYKEKHHFFRKKSIKINDYFILIIIIVTMGGCSPCLHGLSSIYRLIMSGRNESLQLCCWDLCRKELSVLSSTYNLLYSLLIIG